MYESSLSISHYDDDFNSLYHAVVKSRLSLISRNHVASLVKKSIIQNHYSLFLQSKKYLTKAAYSQIKSFKELGLLKLHFNIPSSLFNSPELSGISDIPFDATFLAVNNKDIISLLTNPLLHAIVWSYLDCPAKLTHFKLQYIDSSVANGNECKFHRDRDDLVQVKLFVYLNTVSFDNHPHQFVRSSHINEYSFEKSGNSELLLDSSRFFSLDILQPYLNTNQIAIDTLVGTCGSAVLEDTSGLHRRLPECNGKRLLLNLTWTLTDNIRSSNLRQYNFPISKENLPDFLQYSLANISSW